MTNTRENDCNKLLLENEIFDLRKIDSLILNDVEKIHTEQNLIFIPAGIIYVLSLVGLIYLDKINSGLVSGYAIGLFFIILAIIPSRLRVRKNLKLFNVSKNKLEQIGMLLYRNKTRNLLNPVENLIKVGDSSEFNVRKYKIMPNGDINLSDYRKHLEEL